MLFPSAGRIIRDMNYFAHALHHLDRPYFVAGTAVPDWLSVADRKVRLRPRQLEPWLASDDRIQSEVAAGIARHLDDAANVFDLDPARYP